MVTGVKILVRWADQDDVEVTWEFLDDFVDAYATSGLLWTRPFFKGGGMLRVEPAQME
ncbi:UNVERIFIED_CONTAM: hypothetical protein Sangu_2468500 [Sesamum angustifolium]|uniref:Uncharacterized protein n=1 Tax=Sesamum angustifolium TaxID=2727405 RepID=A0AAW2IYU6_9LAMI